MDELPVVVVGAGPIGLAAAANLVERGLRLVVLEAGTSAGAAGAWGGRSCWTAAPAQDGGDTGGGCCGALAEPQVLSLSKVR